MSDGALHQGTVQRYSPGVLVGNWFNDMRVKEDTVKLYKQQKQYAAESQKAATCNPAALELLTTRLTRPTHLTGDADGPVHFGQPLLLVSCHAAAAVAVDLSPLHAPRPHEVALSATALAAPQVRTTWVLHRCQDEHNAAYDTVLHEADVVHYGQKVRLVNEDADERGFLYLHSELAAGQHASQRQPATAALAARADNVFVLSRARTLRGDVHHGSVVHMKDPVVLVHSITNRPLCCDGTLCRTSYGMEQALFCDYDTPHHSRAHGAVATSEANFFYFTIRAEEDGPRVKRQPVAQDAANMAQTMPMSCGDGAERLLARLRDGAVALGGRVGFRAVSKALGVACEERRRRTLLTRPQLHAMLGRLGVVVRPVELDVLVRHFDHVGNGQVCAQEVLAALRGNLSAPRLAQVVRTFQALTIEMDGAVDFDDLLRLYRHNAAMHPDVEDGLVSREAVVADFESCWPGRVGCKLGTVTLEDFIDYYTDVSFAVPEDARFVRTLERCWAIPATTDYRTAGATMYVCVVHVNDTTERVALPDSLTVDLKDRATIRQLLIQHGVRDIKDFTVTRSPP